MFNYYIILYSNIRKVYYLSKSEVELRILRREIKELSDDLEVIVSGDSYFVVRSDLDEEDKNFLRTFTETSSSEKVIKLGTLLGYACPHPDTLSPRELGNDKYGVSFYVRYRYDEYDKPTTSLLFGFMCQQSIEQIEEACAPLLEDLKNSINELLSVDVFMTIDAKSITRKAEGKSKKRLNRKNKRTKKSKIKR